MSALQACRYLTIDPGSQCLIPLLFVLQQGWNVGISWRQLEQQHALLQLQQQGLEEVTDAFAAHVTADNEVGFGNAHSDRISAHHVGTWILCQHHSRLILMQISKLLALAQPYVIALHPTHTQHRSPAFVRGCSL